MAFNWKSLFVVDEDAEKAAITEKANPQPSKVTEPAKTSFPTASATPVQNYSHNAAKTSPSNSGEAFNEVLAVYEKGFESLNQEGYDFFELYKSVMAVGADNPQSYQMAFAMGKSIKPDLSKNFLLDKAKTYVAEIEKVHAKYAEIGNKKKADLEAQLNGERNNLNNSIKSLEVQIAALQAELNKSKSDLSEIDHKFATPLKDMDERIGANDGAKQTILSSIQKVINGINQNL